MKTKPLILSEKHTEAVCRILREGLTRRDAADEAGIHRDTLYDWLNRGQDAMRRVDAGEEITDDDRKLIAFYAAVRLAERDRKRNMIRELDTTTSHPRVTAITWQLERFAPDEYSSRARVEHTGADGGAIKHEVNGDELLTRLAALAERAGGGNNSG